jgi:hypothetical protein
MVNLLKLISKPKKETPKITVYTIKTRSSVYPEPIEINDWHKYIALSNDRKKMVS